MFSWEPGMSEREGRKDCLHLFVITIQLVSRSLWLGHCDLSQETNVHVLDVPITHLPNRYSRCYQCLCVSLFRWHFPWPACRCAELSRAFVGWYLQELAVRKTSVSGSVYLSITTAGSVLAFATQTRAKNWFFHDWLVFRRQWQELALNQTRHRLLRVCPPT